MLLTVSVHYDNDCMLPEHAINLATTWLTFTRLHGAKLSPRGDAELCVRALVATSFVDGDEYAKQCAFRDMYEEKATELAEHNRLLLDSLTAASERNAALAQEIEQRKGTCDYPYHRSSRLAR